MIQKKDKDLLYIVLCAMLPYDVIVETQIIDTPRPKYPILRVLKSNMLSDFNQSIENVIYKPYLRPMSSMTEEEIEIFNSDFGGTEEDCYNSIEVKRIDWLNKNKFDYRYLIPKGLALPALEGMYRVINRNKIE